MGTFELFKSNANHNYYFHFKSSGIQLLSSEGYTTKHACQNGIDSVRTNAPLDQRYDRKENNGNYSFNLKSANGEIIARSTQKYTTMASRETAISTVKREAPDAQVIDFT